MLTLTLAPVMVRRQHVLTAAQGQDPGKVRGGRFLAAARLAAADGTSPVAAIIETPWPPRADAVPGGADGGRVGNGNESGP